MILLIGVVSVLAFEVAEAWIPAQHHWIEIALYGLLIPGGTWLVLTALTRQVDRQARIEIRLSQLRAFMREVAEQHSSGRLLEFLARYPTATLPVRQAAVNGYDHRQARFVALSAYDAQLGSPILAEAPSPCQACPVRSPVHTQLRACPQADPAAGVEYCLALTYNKLILGRLWLRCAPGVQLDAEQAQTLAALAPEIALALMMASVHTQQVNQAGSSARSDERRQIFVTLHNSLAQQVGYLHLSLDRLAEAPPVALPEAIGRDLAGLRDVAGDAYQQIRELLAGLRAPQFHSLEHLLDSRLQVFSRTTGLAADLAVQGEPRLLPPEMNQRLFALLHEGLNNIQKHAGASRVTLRLEWLPTELVIELVDDGRGFDPAAAVADGHYGLAMLREQVADLRGTLSLTSAPGQGARLHFRLPIPATATGAPLPAPSLEGQP